MFHSWVDPIKKCRLVVVLCGNASGRKRPVGGDGIRYPFPDLASSGFLEARTLENPTIDQFQDVQSATCPDILYFQGQQLESEEELGSLMWGSTDVTDPELFISLIVPPLPKIVYLEAPNSENIAEALRLKGVPYVIYWKNSFTTYAACHFRQALFSVLKCTSGHAWDAFQFAHASFRLYCSKNKCMPASCLQVDRKFFPCFIGDAPKIHVNPVEKSIYVGESSASSLPNIKIHDEYVNVKFLVCGMPCILDACILGSLEDGLSALLNIEIRGSKLHNKVSASSHPCRAATSHGDYKMRCDIITCSSAFISLLVSGSLQTCVDDQLVENLIKNELIDKRQLVHAQPCCEENKFCFRGPLSTDCIAAGASVFEVCIKIPCWAVQILKQLACEFSCRSLVTLGIASIHGIAVSSFEKEDAERLLFFFSRKGKELSKEHAFLSGLPISSSIASGKLSARPEIVIDGNWKDFHTIYSNVSKKQKQMTKGTNMQGLNVAALRPIPCSRRQQNNFFPVTYTTRKQLNLEEQAAFSRKRKSWSSASVRYGIFSHDGDQSKLREHSASSRKHNSSIRGSSVSKPASSMQISSTTKSASFVNEHSTSIHRLAYSIKRRSDAKSDLAKQRISSNPIPLKRHECNRCSIHDCSEEEFLKDLVHFLILRGHQRLVPPGGLSDFPGAVLNAKQLDLYCLYKEVVTRGGYYVGNGINWRGQVFSKMSNHSVNNKMTGITYALKRHYETYLLEYELAHNDVTIDQCVLCHSGTPGDWLSCARCSKWVHLGCDKRSLAAFKDYSKTDGLEYICPHCG